MPHSFRHPFPVPRSWLRLPRRTARLRLTLLYGGMFLACGAALLAIGYGLERASVPSTVTVLGSPGHIPTSAHGRDVPLGHPHERARGTKPTAAALVRIAEHQQEVDLNGQLIWSAVALAIMTLVSIALGWYVAGRALRPVRTITRTARAISARSLDERLALDGPDDEFKELADTLDDLFSRLQAAFESQRHFVANASHELRTPLTVERSLLQVALADPNPTIESLLTTCQNALLNSEQQQHLIDGLLTLASSESGLDQHEPVDLARLTQQALLNPRSEIDHLDLTIEKTLQPAPTEGDPRMLERLASNLIDNAMRHNAPRGSIEIITGSRDDHAFLTVVNAGPVIPTDEVQRLFQPFQRLNGARTRDKNGHGLGLSIVQAISTAHHATLTAQPLPDGGLSISVAFPRPASPSTTADHGALMEPSGRNRSQPVANRVRSKTAKAPLTDSNRRPPPYQEGVRDGARTREPNGCGDATGREEH